MEARSLTPVQQDLLRAFSFNHSDEFALEIKTVLTSYFQKKLDNEIERLHNDGTLTEEVLERLRHEDLHKS